MNPLYEETFIVRTWDVDFSDRLSLAGTFNFCQEVAGYHAEQLGVGTKAFGSQGLVWILSRMSAEIIARPKRTEELIVRTWPRGTRRLFVIRDYEITQPAGRLIAQGRSAWLILDKTSLKPRRPENYVAKLPINEGQNALVDGANELAKQDDLNMVTRRQATFSDIDRNKHVNNARYVQWIQDSVDSDRLAAANWLRLDINFLQEVKPATDIDIYAKNLPIDGQSHWTQAWAVEGRQALNHTAAFRAELRSG